MKVIGIGGYARCGKDTFVSIAKKILEKNNYSPLRVAFADTLKTEVQGMLNLNGFPLDVHTTDTEAKSKVRPLLVWWGCARRDLSPGGLYWVNVVDKQLKKMKEDTFVRADSTDNVVILVSDVRFPNEAEWLHNEWAGQLIHIRRYSFVEFGMSFDAAPNQEEAKNDPLVQAVADVSVEWESRGIPTGGVVTDDTYLQEQVLKALNSTKFFNGKLSV